MKHSRLLTWIGNLFRYFLVALKIEYINSNRVVQVAAVGGEFVAEVSKRCREVEGPVFRQEIAERGSDCLVVGLHFVDAATRAHTTDNDGRGRPLPHVDDVRSVKLRGSTSRRFAKTEALATAAWVYLFQVECAGRASITRWTDNIFFAETLCVLLVADLFGRSSHIAVAQLAVRISLCCSFDSTNAFFKYSVQLYML